MPRSNKLLYSGKTINMKKIAITVFNLLFFLVIAYPGSNIDSLKNELHKNIHDTIKINALNELCWNYNTTDPRMAMFYGEKALHLAIKNEDKYRAAKAYSAIGVVHYFKGEYAEALQYFRKSLAIRTKINDRKGIASSNINIGLIYDIKGDYGKAIQHFLKSLKIQEVINDYNGISKTLSNIGLVYFKQDQAYYEKALEYFKKGLEIKRKLEDKKGIAFTLNKIGSIYYETSKNLDDTSLSNKYKDTALAYFEKALMIRSQINDKKGLAYTLMNIGNIYAEKQEYDKALGNYLNSLSIHKELDDNAGIVNALYNIAFMHASRGDLGNAYDKYNESLRLANSIDNKEWIMQNLIDLAKLNYEMGSYKEAYDLLTRYSKLKDTIFSLKTSNQITELETGYKIEKKEEQIASLKKENHLKRTIINKNKIIIYFLVAAIILIIALSIFIFRNFKQKQKLKQLETLKKTLYEKEILIKEIHHRVKNNLQVIISLISMQENEVDNHLLSNKLNSLKERVRTMAMVHEDLYDHKDYDRIEFGSFIKKMVSNICRAYNIGEKIKTEMHVEQVYLNINIAIPLGMVINELVSNTLKHAFDGSIEQPKLMVQFYKENNTCNIIIKDNGKGLKDIMIMEQPGSMGLKLVHILIKDQLEGEINYSYKSGSEFHMRVNSC